MQNKAMNNFAVFIRNPPLNLIQLPTGFPTNTSEHSNQKRWVGQSGKSPTDTGKLPEIFLHTPYGDCQNLPAKWNFPDIKNIQFQILPNDQIRLGAPLATRQSGLI